MLEIDKNLQESIWDTGRLNVQQVSAQDASEIMQLKAEIASLEKRLNEAQARISLNYLMRSSHY